MITRLEAVRVQEVILNDETNPDRYKSLGGPDAVGTILYTKFRQSLPKDNSTNKLSFAKPLFSSITQYPLVNEIVYILRGPSPYYYEGDRDEIAYYLPAIKIQNHPLHNAFPKVLKSGKVALSNEEIEEGASNPNDQESTLTLGEYFQELENIRPLRPYEGDTIIEGRYGNSIRLGATTFNQLNDFNRWSNEGEIGNPITIIRNGQKEDEQKESFEHILEDIDGDHSSIYLCSNQQITNFTPSSLYQLSFGANLELQEKIEPEPNNEPITEDVEEDIPLATPPPLPPEPEEIPEEEVQEDIADYDISPTEEQVIFPGEDLGDLPENYSNTEGIDVERPMGPPGPPPLHADAEETINVTEQQQLQSSGQTKVENNPYGFYYQRIGPRGKVTVKDKNMNTVYEGSVSSGTPGELINEAKSGLSIY